MLTKHKIRLRYRNHFQDDIPWEMQRLHTILLLPQAVPFPIKVDISTNQNTCYNTRNHSENPIL